MPVSENDDGNDSVTVILATGDKLSSSAPVAGRPKPVHKCAECGKAFRRREHRVRHERGHRNEKPFVCNLCGRHFARMDLIGRHQRSFHPFELKRARQKEYGNAPAASVVDLDVVLGDSEPLMVEDNDICSPLSTSKEPVLRLQAPQSSEQPPTCLEAQLSITRAESSVGLQQRRQSTDVIDNPVSFEDRPEPNTTNLGDTINYFSKSQDGGVQTSPNPVVDLQEFLSPRKTSRNFADQPPSVDEVRNCDTRIPTQENLDEQELMPPNAGLDIDIRDIDFFSTLSYGQSGFDDFQYSFDIGYRGLMPSDKLNGELSASKDKSLPPPTSEFSASSSITTTSPSDCSGTSASIPNLSTHHPKKLPTIVVDRTTYDIITEDVRRRMTEEQFLFFKMPSAKNLGAYLTTYLRSFHRHFPLIHIPHLILAETPSPYILSMSAIGALYRLDRQTARHLWHWAGILVEMEPTSPLELKPETIGYLQCKLILTLFAVFSGDLTEEALSKIGFWTTEYRLRRIALLSYSTPRENLTWMEWALREASKRLLFGVYIMSSLMTMAYGVPPICSVTQDIEIEMPEQEILWEAATAPQWHELINQRKDTLMTVREAMQQLLFGKKAASCQSDHINWSAFATSVVMHAVNVHMWNVMQCTQSFNIFGVDGYGDTELRVPMIAQVETALGRCHSLLTNDSSDREYTSDDAEGPLIFNCLALLRSAYVRVFTGAGSFDRIILLSSDQGHILTAVRSFIGDLQQRSSFLTKAVGKAYGGFSTPIKAGYLLTMKTAALDWSVEHAVSAWDCSLFVTKWIHALEMDQLETPPDQDEMQNLTNFRELVDEVGGSNYERGSLASQVTTIWACFLDDTWVWGITPRMGHVLRTLSTVYAEEWNLKFPGGNPRGPISY